MTQFHKAKKSLGQNFLVDSQVARRVVDSVDSIGNATVIEIGAGFGALTEHLLESARELIAIEVDTELVLGLQKRFGGSDKFSVLGVDALKVDFCSLISPGHPASIVANLPYYISTPILQRLIHQRGCLTELVLMLQREVIDRIIAQPGNSERGYFSVLVQAFCNVEPLFDVPPAAFKPVPKVWSSVARFRFQPNLELKREQEPFFKSLLSASFAQKRKTILNNLRAAPPPLTRVFEEQGGDAAVLERALIDPRARAESLTLMDWQRLLNVILPETTPD